MASMEKSGSFTVWTTYSLEDTEKVYCWQAGPATLWLRRSCREVLMTAYQQSESLSEGAFSPAEKAPADLEWQHWILKDKFKNIALSPSMPDRPLVVTTTLPLTLLPKMQATCYISIPLWINTAAVSEDERFEFMAVPSQVLSSTWFGDREEGKLCYGLNTDAPLNPNDSVYYPHLALCPFTLHNRSSDRLLIKDLYLRTEYLTLYGAQKKIWTNGITASFYGEEIQWRLRYAKASPEFLKNPIRLRKATHKPLDRLIHDTLGYLTSL